MRVKKATPAGTVLYGWENNRIFAEYNETGNAIQETVYFGSTPIALLKDGNTYRIFADQIDTPRVLTDNSNVVLWAWVSKPFGESVPNADVDGDSTELSYNLRFPGQYYDGETGKHYNFNRDYNPVTGRYVQSDPIGLDGGLNGFEYVSSNSLLYFDLTGKRITVQGSVNFKNTVFSSLSRIGRTSAGQTMIDSIYANNIDIDIMERSGKWRTFIPWSLWFANVEIQMNLTSERIISGQYYIDNEDFMFGLAHELWHAWSYSGSVKKIGGSVPALQRLGKGIEVYPVRYTNIIRHQSGLNYVRTHYEGIDIGTY